MNNIDRAAEVIRTHDNSPCREPECIAQDLADAGLLAPDTTVEFDENGVWQDYDEEPEIFVLTKGLPNGFAAIGILDRDEMKLHVRAQPADEIRDVAHALLVAANEAEGKGNTE